MKAMTAVKERFIQEPRFVAQVITGIVVLGLTLGSTPVLAQSGDIGGVVTGLIESITGIIQTVAIGAGILGLSVWAIGKVVRPYFPQVASSTQNYIPDLLVGVAVVFVAGEIVEGIASAIGG